jgi:hypothetical protein
MTSNLPSRPPFHPPRLAPDLGRVVHPVTDRNRPMFATARRKPLPPASAAVMMVRRYLSSPPVRPEA